MRLMSDVPLGAFLSGGVDSTTIVGMMSNMIDSPVNTFSIGYNVGGSDFDDTYYADLVAKRFKTNHVKKIISGKRSDNRASNVPETPKNIHPNPKSMAFLYSGVPRILCAK